MDPYTKAIDYVSNLETIVIPSVNLPLVAEPNHGSEISLVKADQPWPFTFQPGDGAWAKGINGMWRQVSIKDAGYPEVCGGQCKIWYTAEWKYNRGIFCEKFCPVNGNLKPDTERIRKILSEEPGVVIQASYELEDDNSGQSKDKCIIM